MKIKITYLFAITILMLSCEKEADNKVSVTSLEIDNITYHSVLFRGEISNLGSGISDHGVIYNLVANPDDEIEQSLGEFSNAGRFIAMVDNLIAGCEYSIKAYIVENDQYFYGEALHFTTEIGVPIIEQYSDPRVECKSAILTASIIDQGSSIIEAGFYLSTEANFELQNAQKFISENHGSLSVLVEPLLENTSYYYKAFASNNEGITYSDEVSFSTYECPYIEITLTEDDYNLYTETSKYQNFDIRSGSTPGTDFPKLIEMIGYMLETNHSAINDQQYLVTYNYFDGENGVNSITVIKYSDRWEEVGTY